jgi:methylmalonyl-CoA mutase C-terminal domain/subunit
MTDQQIRVVLAKVGLDGHDRGVKVVARALRDAGLEVIYTGLHRTPEEAVSAAVQEDADFLGISLLSGAHMVIVPRILSLMREQGADDIVLFVGGVIPPKDVGVLKEAGVAEVFPQDTPIDDTVAWLRATHAARAAAVRGERS